MEFALSPEKKSIQLFIRGIKWTEIINALKEEEVKVEHYELGYDNDFTNDPSDKIVISNFSISNYQTLFGEIINMIVSFNTLKEVVSIDLERLKAGFPELVEQGLSLDEIWASFFRTVVEREMPYQLRLGNDAFYLECYPGLESYLLTFHSKDKLISFIENANLTLSEQTSKDFVLAAKEEKPYATDGFKAVFEEAGKQSFIALFQNLRAASDKRPNKAISIELAINDRHNYLKLFMEGLHLKDLSKFLNNETVYVSNLEFIIDEDSFIIESHDFKKGEDFYAFSPQKILFGNLVDKIEALNLPENAMGLFSLKLRTSSFELDSHSSPPIYDLTFWRKDAMTDFLDSLKLFVPSEIIDEMKIVVMEGKPYCTEGWREDVEEAGSDCRMDCMIRLLERIWVANEEQELIKMLKIVTQGEIGNNDEEFKLTETDKRMHGSRSWQRPHPYFLAYYRLKEDGMNCFDGAGKIYGFDGELVINSIIAHFSQSRPEIKQEMETLLIHYKKDSFKLMK